VNLRSMLLPEQTNEDPRPLVVIVEDDGAVADLGSELCDLAGARATTFPAALSLMRAMNDGLTPRVVVLDWRLEREVSAGLFLALRHRHPDLPVLLWTGAGAHQLPEMILRDPLTRVVTKGAGGDPFVAGIGWALQCSAADELAGPLEA